MGVVVALKELRQEKCPECQGVLEYDGSYYDDLHQAHRFHFWCRRCRMMCVASLEYPEERLRVWDVYRDC